MSDYCPRDCKHLNITEYQQDMLKGNIPDEYRHHYCLKYGVRLWHLLAHPNLYRCEACLKVELEDEE